MNFKQFQKVFRKCEIVYLRDLATQLVDGLSRNSNSNDRDAGLTEFIQSYFNQKLKYNEKLWVIPGLYDRVQKTYKEAKALGFGLESEVDRALISTSIILNCSELGTIAWGYEIQIESVKSAILKYFLAALAGMLEKFLKYQTAWLAAKGFNQIEFPERPDELPCCEQDGFIIGGSYNRYVRNCFKVLRAGKVVGRNRAKLAWSFSQVKRASEPAPDDFIEANMKKHKTRLTKVLEDEEDDILDELKSEVVRTVREVYLNIRKAHHRVRTPSANGHFMAPRSRGGALGKHFNVYSDIPCLDKLILMYETIPGEALELRGYVDRLDFEMTYQEAKRYAFSREKVQCIPHPILEPFKVRVITLGETEAYWIGKNYQDLLWDQIRRKRTFAFCGQPDTDEFINEIFGNFERKEDSVLVSIDYEAATDNLHPYLSEVCLDTILEMMDAPLEDRYVLLQCLTGHQLNYRQGKNKFDSISQTWGQLMGSPISFPILCLINAAVLRYCYEIMVGQKVLLTHCPLTVNGDDALMIIPESGYELLGRLTSKAGLKFSMGKNYCMRNYCVINSHLYEASPRMDYFGVNRFRFTRLPYINMGLLCGKGRVQDSAHGTREAFTESAAGPTIGAKHHILLEGHEIGIQRRLTTAFIAHNSEVLKQITNIGWFIPQHLGGLGLKWVEETPPKITPFQAKLCAYLECLTDVESVIDNQILMDRTIRPYYVDYAFSVAAKIGERCGFTFDETGYELPMLMDHFVNLCDGSDTETVGNRFQDSFERIFMKAQKTSLNPMSWEKIIRSKPKRLYLRRPWSCSN